MVTGAPSGTVQVWDGRHQLASIRINTSTHGLGVAEAIELAYVLDQLPIRLRVYGIEGRQFELGAEISPQVQRAVAEVVGRIIADLGAHTIVAGQILSRQGCS